MAKDVINIDGEDRTVREDTAKSYRGVVWILTLLGIVLIGATFLFFVFFGGSLGGSDLKSPGEIEKQRQGNTNR